MTAPVLDLLVIGDANPDLILLGGEIEPAFGQRERIVDSGKLVLGGSGSITAVGAARLGLRTALVGAVGNDLLGQFMLEQLAAAGVETEALQVLDNVSTGITVAMSRPEDRAVLTARGAMTMLDPACVPDATLARARHVHIASPFLQPRLRDGLAQLVARAKAAGASVSLDTGWDPEEQWASVASALPLVDLLLPNAQEAEHLATATGFTIVEAQAVLASSGCRKQDGASTTETAATVLADHGPIVVVKLGAEGAIAVRKGQNAVRAAPCRVVSVDATGAGDSFAAGFLAAWLDGSDLADALALACACGALSTRGVGGTAAQATRGEAMALLQTRGRTQ